MTIDSNMKQKLQHEMIFFMIGYTQIHDEDNYDHRFKHDTYKLLHKNILFMIGHTQIHFSLHFKTFYMIST